MSYELRVVVENLRFSYVFERVCVSTSVSVRKSATKKSFEKVGTCVKKSFEKVGTCVKKSLEKIGTLHYNTLNEYCGVVLC